ncbi:hypothetical protein THAOC_29039, partial [Thalassiosira oceanica]
MVRISTLLIALSVGLLAQLPSAFVPSVSPPVRTGRTGHHDDRFTLSMSDATFQPPSNGKEGANEVDELRSHFRERGGAIAAVSLLISAAIVNPQALSTGFSIAFSSVLMYPHCDANTSEISAPTYTSTLRAASPSKDQRSYGVERPTDGASRRREEEDTPYGWGGVDQDLVVERQRSYLRRRKTNGAPAGGGREEEDTPYDGAASNQDHRSSPRQGLAT